MNEHQQAEEHKSPELFRFQTTAPCRYCDAPGLVPVSPAELARIADYVGVAKEEALREYCRHEPLYRYFPRVTLRAGEDGNGFEDVILETKKVAVYVEMSQGSYEDMKLLTEEMLSMAQAATGDMEASFWIECVDGACDLHLNTRTVLNKEQRYHLISTSTSGKNEIANTPFGRLRDRFEQARAFSLSAFTGRWRSTATIR